MRRGPSATAPPATHLKIKPMARPLPYYIMRGEGRRLQLKTPGMMRVGNRPAWSKMTMPAFKQGRKRDRHSVGATNVDSAAGVRRGGHLDFFPGVSVIRRTVRRSRTESITPAGSRPSRIPWKPLGRLRLRLVRPVPFPPLFESRHRHRRPLRCVLSTLSSPVFSMCVCNSLQLKGRGRATLLQK